MSDTRVVKNAKSLVQAYQDEAIKEYLVYDGSSRMTDHYSARADASNGDPCLHTQYAYSGGSNLVIYRKETLSTWQTVWEAF